ncbi:glycosyltransferase family 2 protein [Candidatus Bathyarchaeota archaeon]|nr:glycosyltransferase family 2 protein [Candidatus Bathyarchaeota archaeon]
MVIKLTNLHLKHVTEKSTVQNTNLICNADEVAIILLTYNSVSKLQRYFDKVLHGLLAQDYSNLKIFIIDNGSTDNTVDYVKIKGNGYFKILHFKKNLGWSGGNNRGAILCRKSSFLFFINDDVILENNCVRELVNFLNKEKTLGAVQPLIKNRDGSLFCGAILSFSGLPHPVTRPPKHPWFEVFYASGAALFVRTRLFFEVGMFDEDFFFWRDDVDFCWRLRLAGYKVACFTRVKAHHYVSATLGEHNPIISYYFTRNNIWLLAKCCSLKNFLLKFFIFILEVSMNIPGLLLIKDYKRVLNIIKGVLDGLFGLGKAILKKKRIIRRIEESKINKMTKIYFDIRYMLSFFLKLKSKLNLFIALKKTLKMMKNLTSKQ